ncbi:MAG TPA: LCP family protein [Anaerolineales bacterium]|nr:LCP family protein [Anaerolineales bacterium]HRQ91620.1 LCP family protein [Anaerolineales bacterium]
MLDPYENYEPPLRPDPEDPQPATTPPATPSPRPVPPAAARPRPAAPITSRELAGRTTLEATRASRPAPRGGRGCLPVRLLLLLVVAAAAYLLTPLPNNLLIMGIDRAPDGTDIGRSDTMILISARPLAGRIEMLSIPRDLWIPIPGYGENRINAAHAFGEGAKAGGGPRLALETIRSNFNINVSHYLRIRLAGFPAVVDALGGVPITLDAPTAGYPAGTHHLNGTQALAFVRDRSGDDFLRMAHGQLFIVAVGKKMLNPLEWFRIPGGLIALNHAVDTNLPIWLWPRYAVVFLRAIVFDGLHAVTLPREAVTPWVTSGGAQVLLPNWSLILPILKEMFSVF